MNSTIRVELKPKNNLLVAYRKERGWLQRRMAAFCGVPVPDYNRAENMRPILSLYMDRIACATRIPRETLFPAWSVFASQGIRQSYIVLDDDQLIKRFTDEPRVPSLLDFDASDITDALRHAMLAMPQRTADILVRRYGLFGEPPMRLCDLAARHRISIGRVQQVSKQGFDAVRRTLGAELLREFLHAIDVRPLELGT